MSVIQTWNLYLDSSQRDAGTPSSWSLHLNSPICILVKGNRLDVSITSLDVPLCWPMARGLAVAVNAPGGVSGTVQVPDGSYSIGTLLSTLSQLITAWTQTVALYPVSLAFTWSRDTFRASLALANLAANDGKSIGLQFNDATARCLGFDPDTTITLTKAAGGVGVRPINVAGSRALFVRSDSLRPRNTLEALLQDKDDHSNILCRVPIAVQAGSYITVKDPLPAVTLASDTIDQVSLYLTDNQSTDALPVTLDWGISLRIQEIGQRPTNDTLSDEDRRMAQLTQALIMERRLIETEIRRVRADLMRNLKHGEAPVKKHEKLMSAT